MIKRLVHPDHDQRVTPPFFSPDGRWILASSGILAKSSARSVAVQIWEANTGEQVRTLRMPIGPQGFSNPPVLTPDARTLYWSLFARKISRTGKTGKEAYHYEMNGAIAVWDVTSGRQLPSLKHAPPHAVQSIRLSPDGAFLLSIDYRATDAGTGMQPVLTQWDLRTGKPHHLLDGFWSPVFAPDSKTFAASLTTPGAMNHGKLVLWDVASGKERRVLAETKKGQLYSSAFSPDGRYLAGCQDARSTEEPPEVKLWETASGKEVGSFAAPKGAIPFRRLPHLWAFGAPAFSPDGRWLAACQLTGRVYLYDVTARKLAWSQEVKNGWLREVKFSPDGRWLAVTAQDLPVDLQRREDLSPFDLPQPRIFLFDMKAGGPPEEIVAPHGMIGRLAFSPDSKTLALSGTGCVWLFDVSRPVTRK